MPVYYLSMCYLSISFLSLLSVLSTNLPSSSPLPFLKLFYPVPHLPTHPSIHHPFTTHPSILHPTTHSPVIHTSVTVIRLPTHSFPTQIHLSFVSSIYSPSIHPSIYPSVFPQMLSEHLLCVSLFSRFRIFPRLLKDGA